jgi:outer membrane immunogenic protein
MLRRAAAIFGGSAAICCALAQPAVAQFAPSWSGLYAGLHAGFARGESSFDPADLAAAGFTSPVSISRAGANGAGFGFGGGINWQAGLLVFGLEADWTRLTLGTTVPFAANIAPFGAVTGTLGADVNWAATARLRAGLTVGRALIFGTAGLAVASARGELAVHGVGAPFSWTDSALLGGWALGAGIEYALTPSWSVKGEIMRMHFGSGPFSSATGSVPVSSNIELYNLRAGMNFRF